MESELEFSRETEAIGDDIDTDIDMRVIIRSWLPHEIMGLRGPQSAVSKLET